MAYLARWKGWERDGLRAHYGEEGCGWILAGLRMRAHYYPGERNLLPIQADFVTERGIPTTYNLQFDPSHLS